MNQSARIEVYTDGECPLCQWMRSKVEPFDREHRIDWMNYRDRRCSVVPPPILFRS